MQKLILPMLLVFAFVTQSNAQQRLFDQAVQLKTCNISIEANPFIATTVIEMEFYNPKDQEVEGYQAFELNRGQVITDFQLELNGKYREGSIEERWKARQAYSKIVGKRIDPAILQMNGLDHYSINIYPIAAKSSRRIKFTITQMMTEENLKLSYTLPLKFTGTTNNFTLDVKVNKPASIPNANAGLIENQLFSMHNDEATLWQQKNDIILNQPISFSISQFTNQPQFCVNKKDGKSNFIMRYYPDVKKYYPFRPKSINVYWDVSLSGKERNLSKELDFLEKYISVNEIEKTTIILFNHQLQGTIVFNRTKDDFNSIRNFLIGYKYAGATELGNLNLSNVLADAVLLFSDGINSIGNAQPKLGAVQVNFITSTPNYYYRYNNYRQNNNIVGNTGGSAINLYYTDVKDAVKRIDTAENFLFKYTASNIHINEPFPVKLGNSILLSGTIDQADNLELFYGNNTTTTKSENYFIKPDAVCDETTYKKIQMLKSYDSLVYYYDWQHMVVFGLTERVVTPQTSFLVLERIEDYINYKIAPPKELEAQCAELNYVYKSEYKIKALKEFTEQDALELVVKDYNRRITWWSKDEALIDLKKPIPEQKNIDIATAPAGDKTISAQSNNFAENNFPTGGTELKEVVVTSAFGIKRTARSTASNVQNLTSDQINTIRQVNINNALAGKVAGVQVRSQSIAKLGAETMIRLRGENGIGLGTGAIYVVDGTIMTSGGDINPDDVEDISILQGPSAAALFGPDGSNGAIVITLKRAKRGYPRQYYTWSEYKLSSTKDEDYVVEMRNAADYELWDTYLELEKENKLDVGFYFEMANFFFEKGRTDKAQELMYNAIELCNGSTEGLKLTAYFYEKWKWFDKAIAVYKGILSSQENNLTVKRDLALAYFQNKNFEASVKTYYSILTAPDETNYKSIMKENALAEMNAIIAIHKNEFDISYINHNLVKLLPVDLRITMGGNHDYLINAQFIEPGNTACNTTNKLTANGGRFTGQDYYWQNNLSEYAIKNAPAGSYRIKVNANNNYSYAAQIPIFVRVITFRNFQKDNMDVEIKMFDLDNQYGVVELDEVKW
ncbi:MAG: VIT domain-containing protein [Ferruginibacter sp.]